MHKPSRSVFRARLLGLCVASPLAWLTTSALAQVPSPSVPPMAPPPFQASPEVYKVIAENATHRVVEVTWAPGQRDAAHSHPTTATYFLTDCKLRFFQPDGSTHDAEPKAGTATILAPVSSHSAQNMGKQPCKVVMFEPK